MFFTMYSKVHVLGIWKNHEYVFKWMVVLRMLRIWGKNNECMHMKCKYVVTIMWNIL
jgi:hypothetical protein